MNGPNRKITLYDLSSTLIVIRVHPKGARITSFHPSAFLVCTRSQDDVVCYPMMLLLKLVYQILRALDFYSIYSLDHRCTRSQDTVKDVLHGALTDSSCTRSQDAAEGLLLSRKDLFLGS